MADFTKLHAVILDLSAKIDILIAKQVPLPADEQPAVDAVTVEVEAIVAKLPA